MWYVQNKEWMGRSGLQVTNKGLECWVGRGGVMCGKYKFPILLMRNQLLYCSWTGRQSIAVTS